MEAGREGMWSSQAEENVRDFLRLLQEACRTGVALDNMKETSFSGAPSNASTSPSAGRDDHTNTKKKEDEEEQKMAVVYIVLVLLSFSASLIVLLVRHVRREKETRKLERFYRDYLLTSHSSPVVYFDEQGRPLQRKGLQLSPSRPHGAGPDATSTSAESDIAAPSRPSVSTPASASAAAAAPVATAVVGTAAAAGPCESSGTDVDEIIVGTNAGNCFCDAKRHLSPPVTPGAPVDGAVSAAGHANAPVQPGNVAPSTVTPEGAKTECDTAPLNATLAPTLPVPEKCIECDNPSIEATAELNTCQLSIIEPAAATQTPQRNTNNSPALAKLIGKSTSV